MSLGSTLEENGGKRIGQREELRNYKLSPPYFPPWYSAHVLEINSMGKLFGISFYGSYLGVSPGG